MKKRIDLIDAAIIYSLVFTIFLSSIFLIVGYNHNNQVQSLVIGTVLSVILNYYHQDITRNIAENEPKRLKKFTIFSIMIRYSIYALIIVLGIIFNFINPIFMIIGISEYHLIMVLMMFIRKE